mmetsp:Transcript_19695/g.30414  ORF Transcript_19695/g.30414 Transcript_19695/m.30414 type:complete len:133 (-) Transcript_19695:20-418(-)
MHNSMEKMEQEMAANFKHGMEIAAHPPAGGDVQSQSFQSSSRQEMGSDGKMHKQTKKSGTKMQCHNGKCEEVKCEDGHCKKFTNTPPKKSDDSAALESDSDSDSEAGDADSEKFESQTPSLAQGRRFHRPMF